MFRSVSSKLLCLALVGCGLVFALGASLSAFAGRPEPARQAAHKPASAHARKVAGDAASATSAATTHSPRKKKNAKPRTPVAPLSGNAAREAIVQDLEESLGARVRVRWDEGRDLSPRSIRLDGASPVAGTPLAVARSVLSSVLDAIGSGCPVVLPPEAVPGEGLALASTRTVDAGESFVVAFSAFLDGLPVEDSTLKVELERKEDGLLPVNLVGRFHFARTAEGLVSPAVEASLPRRYPETKRGGFTVRPSFRLVAQEVKCGLHVKAFEVTAMTGPADARHDVIDAGTGEVLASYPISCSGEAQAFVYEKDPRKERSALPLSSLYVKKGRKRATTDEDGAFSLAGTVKLDQGFAGPFVRVLPDGQSAFAYEGPADFTLFDSPDDEASVHQDEAAAFYDATTYNAYMRATYADIAHSAKVRFPIVVASDFENAFFAPTAFETDDGEQFPGYVDLGVISGNSCARDSSVVDHEYTHALLNGVASLYGTDEALGVNEALADYFPCARAESPRIGVWTRPPYVRALDDKPRKLVWPRDAEEAGMEVHRIGNIFNQALWHARTRAEHAKKGARLAVDQAVFGGVLRMPDSPSLADAREAIVRADEALNGGAHLALLESAFSDHGVEASGSRETGEDTSPDPASSDVVFSSPTKKSFVVHTDETVEIPVEAASASGARVKLTATKLENATFEHESGARATGTLTFTPSDDQRGRASVTFTATCERESATRTITLVVRRPRK